MQGNGLFVVYTCTNARILCFPGFWIAPQDENLAANVGTFEEADRLVKADLPVSIRKGGKNDKNARYTVGCACTNLGCKGAHKSGACPTPPEAAGKAFCGTCTP